MVQFKRGDRVWCNKGKPSYEPDGNFVGIINGFIGTLVYVENPLTQICSLHKAENLIPLYDCPIDNAANLHSDWIEDELVRHSYFDGRHYYGWIYGADTGNEATTKKYPIKCAIFSDGSLRIKKFDDGDETFNRIVAIINDLFNCNPNDEVVASYEVVDNIMLVKFYYLSTEE